MKRNLGLSSFIFHRKFALFSMLSRYPPQNGFFEDVFLNSRIWREVFQENPWAASVVSPIKVDKPVYVLNFTSTFLSTSFLIHFSDRADYMAFGTNDMEAHPWAADFSHHALPFP